MNPEDNIPFDIYNEILSFLGNLELAALACISHFWKKYLAEKVIPIKASYLGADIHFGNFTRRVRTNIGNRPCPCPICVRLSELKVLMPNTEPANRSRVSIIKHIHGPYNPNWREYIAPEYHELLASGSRTDLFCRIILEPNMRISRRFAEWLQKNNAAIATNFTDEEKDYYRCSVSINLTRVLNFPVTAPANSDNEFAYLIPIYGGLLLFSLGIVDIFYCYDFNSPHYDHLYVRGSNIATHSFTALCKFSEKNFNMILEERVFASGRYDNDNIDSRKYFSFRGSLPLDRHVE